MFLKLVQFGSKICTAGNKIRFKVIHHLLYRENVQFLLPPLILRLYTRCRLGQTLSKCIASYKKNKSAKMLRIDVRNAYEKHLKLCRLSLERINWCISVCF